ncbi:MAG: hypothetical protein PHW24_01315 [Candidatus Moranbacteria bacterium]|nr:hypothetical protein [Candidatus Moranbacteria bacterium]
MRETIYKKFIDNGNGDCIYCNERSHDCRCDEKTAESLGYHYDHIPIIKALEVPPMPDGLDAIGKLMFSISHPTSMKTSLGVWRKGDKWFRTGYDLVDYHNHVNT